MGLTSFLVKQARKPSGWFGRVFAGKILNKANASLEDMGLKLMDVKPDSSILEIGFGNGRLISKMGIILKTGKITGIDISKEMIDQSGKTNKRLIRSGHLELIEASVANIPVADQSFDKVFTANTIYFWPNPDENIKEVLRTLSPGGIFYCALRTKDEMLDNKHISAHLNIFKHTFSEEEITAFLEKSGFKDVSIHAEEGKYFTDVIAVGTKG